MTDFTEFDADNLRSALESALGPSLYAPFTARLGNPADGKVVVPEDLTDRVGAIYIHDAASEQSPGMVMNTVLRADELIYGAPVLITWDGVQYKIAGRDDELWTEFHEGVYHHDQRVVSIDQLDYATLHPVSPTPSMFAVVTGGVYTLDNVAYHVATQLTQDFTALIPTNNGKGKAYRVEVDPTTGTLAYTAGAEFPAELNHEQAFAGGFYPTAITASRFLHGWIVLVKGMAAIESGRYIFNAPEYLSKGQNGTVGLSTGGTGADLSATGPGHVIQASNGAALSILKHNLAASAAPTTGDDSGDGYAVGSLWIDTTADKGYVCLDATAAAAVWTETTAGGGAPVGVGVHVDETSGETMNTSFNQGMAYSNEVTDTDGFHESVTNPSRLTVPAGKAGLYYIYADINLAITTKAVDSTGFQIKLNNTTFLTIDQQIPHDETASPGSLSVTKALSVSDYVELVGDNTGASNSVDAFSSFGMFLIGT